MVCIRHCSSLTHHGASEHTAEDDTADKEIQRSAHAPSVDHTVISLVLVNAVVIIGCTAAATHFFKLLNTLTM